MADAEAHRAAAEKQRIAEEEERKRAAENAQRMAEETRRAEEKRRQEAIAVYRNAPKSPHDMLNVLKKLQAKTEVGIIYADYMRAVGDMWGDVKVFADSPDGKRLPELSSLAIRIVGDYKTAGEAWHWQIEYSFDKSGEKYTALGDMQQNSWKRADTRLRMAESLLDSDEVEQALKAIAADKETAEDLDAKLHRILTR